MVNQYYFLTASGIIDKKHVYTFKLCNKLCKLKCNKYVLKPTSNKLSLKFLFDDTSSDHSLSYSRKQLIISSNWMNVYIHTTDINLH